MFLSLPGNLLNGFVVGNGAPQAGYQVYLYASYAKGRPYKSLLGTDISDASGHFEIKYKRPPGLLQQQRPILYIIAEKGKAMLASAIGDVKKYDSFVVTEQTTVAMGVAFAQFIDGYEIYGNKYGTLNAVKMAANMADPKTGNAGEIISMVPNGHKTSTYSTFNTIANIVASCVANSNYCDTLFAETTPAGTPAIATVLQAIANMTKYPSNKVDELFSLSTENPLYQPRLASTPTSWLLFIKFTGGFYYKYASDNLMSGPGNIAFNERGYAWINDNYVPTAKHVVSCAGLRLLKFYPR